MLSFLIVQQWKLGQHVRHYLQMDMEFLVIVQDGMPLTLIQLQGLVVLILITWVLLMGFLNLIYKVLLLHQLQVKSIKLTKRTQVQPIPLAFS